MNSQTPGPLHATEVGVTMQDALRAPDNTNVAMVNNTSKGRKMPRGANARLLAAAYNAFDRAGRELGVDAASLAQKIDLVTLIREAEGK